MILSPKRLWPAAKLLVAQWRSQTIDWRLMKMYLNVLENQVLPDLGMISLNYIPPAKMCRWRRSLVLIKQFSNFKFRPSTSETQYYNSCDVMQTKITWRLFSSALEVLLCRIKLKRRHSCLKLWSTQNGGVSRGNLKKYPTRQNKNPCNDWRQIKCSTGFALPVSWGDKRNYLTVN